MDHTNIFDKKTSETIKIDNQKSEKGASKEVSKMSNKSKKIQKDIKQVLFRVDKNAITTARILDHG